MVFAPKRFCLHACTNLQGKRKCFREGMILLDSSPIMFVLHQSRIFSSLVLGRKTLGSRANASLKQSSHNQQRGSQGPATTWRTTNTHCGGPGLPQANLGWTKQGRRGKEQGAQGLAMFIPRLLKDQGKRPFWGSRFLNHNKTFHDDKSVFFCYCNREIRYNRGITRPNLRDSTSQIVNDSDCLRKSMLS